MDRQQQIRRKVDDLFRKNKARQYTLDEIATHVDQDTEELKEILFSVVRCPFTLCQSFDTAISEKGKGGFEVHHCNRCDRFFHVERDPDGGYAILGWYGE